MLFMFFMVNPFPGVFAILPYGWYAERSPYTQGNQGSKDMITLCALFLFERVWACVHLNMPPVRTPDYRARARLGS